MTAKPEKSVRVRFAPSPTGALHIGGGHTAKRVYKDPMPSREALSVMTGAMSAHFDPDVMRVLLMSVGIYPAGSLVELSDGSVGTVVGAYSKDLVRPKVALHLDRFGKRLLEKQLVDLCEERDLFVKRSLQSDDKRAF